MKVPAIARGAISNEQDEDSGAESVVEVAAPRPRGSPKRAPKKMEETKTVSKKEKPSVQFSNGDKKLLDNLARDLVDTGNDSDRTLRQFLEDVRAMFQLAYAAED